MCYVSAPHFVLWIPLDDMLCDVSFPQLGITTMTPSGLLQGAKSIVVRNKQLRNELRALEREIKTIRDQNNFMVIN